MNVPSVISSCFKIETETQIMPGIVLVEDFRLEFFKCQSLKGVLTNLPGVFSL
jgi:hypothetical protein